MELTEERSQQIQAWIKDSLRQKSYGSEKGRMWSEGPEYPVPDKVYTKYKWVKRTRATSGVKPDEYNLPNVTQMLSEKEIGGGAPVRILLEGDIGSGKSTALKHIAQGWADGTAEDLKQFQYVFHIVLQLVDKDQNIEDIIIEQHQELKKNKVKPEEIKAILETDSSKQKILFLLDGHDEYTKVIIEGQAVRESNENIDRILAREMLQNVWMVVTSTETGPLSEMIHAAAQIMGFDRLGIQEYATKYLGSEQLYHDMMSEITDEEHDILRVPILLHMACVLFRSKGALPGSVPTLLSAMVDRSIDLRTVRREGDRKIKRVKHGLSEVGFLAFKGLRHDHYKFRKDELLEIMRNEDLHLGLLVGMESSPGQEAVESDVLSFHHVLIQKFMAAKFVASQSKHELEKIFESWDHILLHRDELKYACLASDQPDVLVDFICDRLSQDYIDHGYNHNRGDVEFLKSIKLSIQELRTVDPLHNKYINFVTEQTSNLYQYVSVPSRFYVFDNLMKDVSEMEEDDRDWFRGIRDAPMRYIVDKQALTNHDDEYISKPHCALCVNGDYLRRSLKIIREISKYQSLSVTRLCLTELDFTESAEKSYEKNCEMAELTFETFRLGKHVGSVRIEKSILPLNVYRHIANQLTERKQLEQLILSGNRIAAPVRLNKTMAGLDSLKILNLNGCNMSVYMSEELADSLRHLPLEKLNLGKNTLTDCLEVFLFPSGFPKLKTLILNESKLSKDDLKYIAEASSSGLLPQLTELDLSDNSLKNRVEILLSHGSGFPTLKGLHLFDCNLSKADIKNISDAAQAGKLPILEELNLKFNILTDCVSDLLGGTQPHGFPTLKKLFLQGTEPSDADLVVLSESVAKETLPKLEFLDLQSNALGTRTGEIVERLVKDCLAQYKLGLKLQLAVNYLGDKMNFRLKTLCKDTNITLDLW